jgi:hypothetical protein
VAEIQLATFFNHATSTSQVVHSKQKSPVALVRDEASNEGF